MEKQLDEVIPRRFLIDMFGNLPLYHVRFGRLVSGANPEIGESLIKLSDLGNAIANLPYKHDTQVIRCKECKYWLGNNHWCCYDMNTVADDYCSKAERKEE